MFIFYKPNKLFINLFFRNEDIDLNSMAYEVNVEKVKSLGIEFTPTETSLRDTVFSLQEKCLL